MDGSVGILNVGAGDVTLSFDKSNPAERERAAVIVADMLKRGYAILIQVGEKEGEPLFQRIKAFDETKCEYIIMDGPDEHVHLTDLAAEGKEPDVAIRVHTGKSKRGRPRRIPAESTRAVAVSRTAGG